MSSLLPITGSTLASVSPTTPNRRARAATAESRSRAVPAVAGYPDAEPAAASACWITGATGSTGVPTDRSTMPSGCEPASALASASVSQGNSGRAAETAGRRFLSWCGTGPLSRLRLAVAGP